MIASPPLRTPPPRRAPRAVARGPRTSGRILSALTVATLLLAVGAGVGTVGARAAGPSATSPGPWTHVPGPGFGSWTNGVVSAAFPTLGPSLRFSSASDTRISTSLRLAGLAEISPGHNFTAFASFAPGQAAWFQTNATVNGTLELIFSAAVPVTFAQGAWESGDDGTGDSGPIGNASLQVDVFLNQSTGGAFNSTRVAVSVTYWPWVNATDSLGLDMALFAGPSTRVASTVGPGPNQLRVLANGTDTAIGGLSWASEAAVHYGNGTDLVSTVSVYSATAADGTNSTVKLLFDQVEGNYSTLSYDPWLSLDLGTFPSAPIPLWALDMMGWGVLAAGIAVIWTLAILALRRRRQPPDDL